MYLHVKVDFTREYCKWLDFYVDTLLIMLFQSLDLFSTDIQQLTQCMVWLLTAYTVHQQSKSMFHILLEDVWSQGISSESLIVEILTISV